MPDDYPNNSGAFMADMPEERKELEDKERSTEAASSPVIQEVIDWLANNAKAYRSPKVMQITESTPAEEVKSGVLFANKMSAEYESKLASFRTRFAKYLDQ